MTDSTTDGPADRPVDPGPPRRRDAARTRALLLETARRRFSRDGYAATTVRDLADEAGVNVALISRYFESKEGLFEACLAAAVQELSQSASAVSGRADVGRSMARQATARTPDGGPDETLLLLLRSSGDERAEAMRLGVLRSFGERLAVLGGWTPGDPDPERRQLRAQLCLSTVVGMVVLRSSRLEPLGSAGEDELALPLQDVVDALLG